MKLFSSSLLFSFWMLPSISAQQGVLDSCSKQNDCISYTIEEEKPRLCTTRNCQIKICLTLDVTKPECTKSGQIDYTCAAGGSANPQTCNPDFEDLMVDRNQNGLGYLKRVGTQCQTVTAGTVATFVLSDGGSCAEDYAGDGVASCVARTTSDASCSGNETFTEECFWHIMSPPCGATPTISPSALPSMLPTESAAPSILPSEMPSETQPTPYPTPYPTPLPTPNPTPFPTPAFTLNFITTRKPISFNEDEEESDKPDPGVSGDPHFKTWSGENYDFHGICDLVLLQNPDFQDGLGMDIHVRTKQLNQFSYVSSAVLKIGYDTLEVMGDSKDNLHWINQQGNSMMDDGVVGFLSGFPIVYTKVNSKQDEFTVKIGHDKFIVMKTFKKFVRVSIHGATKENFGTSLGLLGSYRSGKMLARDGLTIFEDANEFGQNWQVAPSDEILFHELEGPQSPELCEIPQASSVRRRLAESYVSEKDAEIACGRVNPDDFDMCVFDVMATGDKDVVGAY